MTLLCLRIGLCSTSPPLDDNLKDDIAGMNPFGTHDMSLSDIPSGFCDSQGPGETK